MITTLFRMLATPLAVFLDHVMVLQRTHEFVDLSEQLRDDTDVHRDTKAAV
ncbi:MULTISPECIES: hypothetical protein [unclassified Rhodococcus (in: high G+C Gram-positive bacteria)]|uniref:hypothetical protein n=1 Tax=unclassified Rhodococcus (in: high G+C Gram-positive bacteria) TaxID=192944 RepID=UPI0003708C6F|nr:hypothetical protein [Rhodococcus sp. DK17]